MEDRGDPRGSLIGREENRREWELRTEMIDVFLVEKLITIDRRNTDTGKAKTREGGYFLTHCRQGLQDKHNSAVYFIKRRPTGRQKQPSALTNARRREDKNSNLL